MKKIKVLGTLILILAVLIPGCTGCQGCNKVDDNGPPKNIIVLLDLSDRVSKEKYKDLANEQMNEDINNCQTIIDVYKSIVKDEVFRYSQSTLQFFIPDQQGFKIKSTDNKILQTFGEGPIGSADKFQNLEKTIIATINELYREVLTMPQDNFTGADIWMWFKDEAKRHLDPESENYIICLSDGYLEFNEDIQGTRKEPGSRKKGTYMLIDDTLRQSDNWEEEIRNKHKLLKPSGVDFSKYKIPVQFMLIGIKDRTSERPLHEKDILKLYWELWLESMGIAIPKFYPSDVTKKEIATFLNAANL